ncbi:MAG: hypothetical protein HY696_03680 [Deltaproteobacteria bacterium]|nr:hypothetical protein [Deltaproteobacteria bacterium]
MHQTRRPKSVGTMLYPGVVVRGDLLCFEPHRTVSSAPRRSQVTPRGLSTGLSVDKVVDDASAVTARRIRSGL